MLRALVSVAVLLTVSPISLAADEAVEEAAFRAIFNGRNLDGWEGDPAYWHVENGAIVGRSTPDTRLIKPNSSYLLWTGGEVSDFELRVKFNITRGNSGIQYRSRRLPNGQVAGYQADIQANRREVTGVLHEQAGRQILARHGERVTIDEDGRQNVMADPRAAEKLMQVFRPGKWNEYLILARGPEIEHRLNGQTILHLVDHQRGKAAVRGIVAFQLHWGPAMTVRFKDVELKARE